MFSVHVRMLDSFCQSDNHCPALLVNLTITVVPKTDHKQRDYLTTVVHIGQISIPCSCTSGYIICVVQTLSQVMIFA